MHFRRVRSRWLRYFRAAHAGLHPLPPGNKEEPGRASPPNLGADLSKHFFSCLGNKSSAREPPFGVQAGIRKDKPEGNGAASRTKGGSRARCARGSGSQLSSPVRAEHVVSFTKPLQRLVCRGLGLPRVGLQTGSVCRGRGEKYHDAISNCPHPENCRWAYNRGMGKQNFLFPHVHSKTSSSFSPAMGRFAYEQHNDKDKHFLLTRRRSPVLFLR